MPLYTPGSFTKNFGWSQSPPGLHALYVAIRAGFGSVAQRVSRDKFRSQSGIQDHNRQLIPVNFFLHNTLHLGVNYVSVDELVRHAINNPHSRTFDQLALFAMHFGRMGSRTGVAGNEYGAAFTGDFVRNRLWDSGGWESDRLTSAEIETSFAATIQAQGGDTVHKCTTNYLYMTEITGLKGQGTPFINNHIEEWIGPALFLAFDRYVMDLVAGSNPAELLAMVETDQLHKLMGTTESYLNSVAPLLAAEYSDLGGLSRVTAPAVLDAAGAVVVSSPVAPWTSNGGATATKWSDQDAQAAAIVVRRLQQTQAQIRNAQNVRELKALYEDACMFCGKRTVIGVGPDKYYSEAAHIKPVGQPHNGPDQKDNMLVLCPEHHLQFDYGVLRIRQRHRREPWVLYSKVPHDPLDESEVRLKSPHLLNSIYAAWHYAFWES